MKMQLADWQGILHFSTNEKWGDWTKLDNRVIPTLDKMRDYCGQPIVVHCAYELSGHTTSSQHYKGLAVDFHIVGMKLIDQYLLAERFGWTGIGVYPDWNNVGLHCDYRETEIGARWAQVKKSDGKLEYCNLDEKLIEYIIAKDV